jgi:predicted transposase YdaD
MTAPHDRFFLYLFSPPARAEALLRHNLPAPLTALVDWPTLRRESGTLADWQRETRKDLLFSARLLHAAAHEPPHFFLIEHQSTVHRWMAGRTHDYAWRLIQNWRQLNPRSRLIPQVTPLVVYPRMGKRWSAPLRLEDHYSARLRAASEDYPAWALRSAFTLDDMDSQNEQAVRARLGPALVALGLLVLSYAGTEQLALRLPHWSDLFTRVHATDYGTQALYRVGHYVHELGDARAAAALQRVLYSMMESTRAEAFMRTMAEVLKARGHRLGLLKGRAEGKAEGKAEGEAKGLAEAVLQVLASRGVLVHEFSQQRIQSCRDVATLKRWLDRSLHATRLSDVLDGPAQ